MKTIKLKKPNPLDYYGVRTSLTPPPHFEYISIPIRYNLERSINRWISEHLKGRYYIGKTIGLNKERGLEEILQIGFEEPKELSYFTLACPHLKYK